MKGRYIFLLLFAVSLAVVGSSDAATTGLTIQPIKASHTIEPGESVSGTITLSNASEADVSVFVTIEDFVPSAGGQGVQFVGRAEGVTTVRDWITIGGDDSFIFKNGESRGITYTITAPPDAEPGGHFGVAFFKANEIGGTGQLQIGTRVGVLIFVTVPGDFLQQGKIVDFSAPFFVQKGPILFTTNFENTGTVHFEPKGTITISNIFGKKVAELPVSGTAVLPTGARELKTRWDAEGFLLGRYTAQIVLFDGEGNELTAEGDSFYAFPLWYLLSFVLTILVLFFGLKFVKRKFRISVSVNR